MAPSVFSLSQGNVMRRALMIGLLLAFPTPAMAQWYVAQRGANRAVIYTAADASAGSQPLLVIECSPRETSITVDWKEPVAGFYAQSVIYSVDGARRRTEQWRVSIE